ncbi:MAG: cold shock and DUF1294 domain-containing protein [Campylobacterales bacterium]|nr:cold shock and DUF1294 domain-containing protein [Campylobacterales bacterium]
MLKKKGKVIKWDDAKGFGFILPEDSKQHIFVHIKSFIDRSLRPSLNEEVTYTIFKDKDGRQSAINVSRVTDKLLKNKQKNIRTKKNITLKSIANTVNKNPNSQHKIDYKSTHTIGIFHIIFILSFLAFLLFSFIDGKLPFLIIIFYGLMSIITYFMYSTDKSKAIIEEYRIQEKKLHMLSFIGGWIGAMIAQQRFRHKTKKSSFQIVFWITVFLNISVLIYQFKLLWK